MFTNYGYYRFENEDARERFIRAGGGRALATQIGDKTFMVETNDSGQVTQIEFNDGTEIDNILIFASARHYFVVSTEAKYISSCPGIGYQQKIDEAPTEHNFGYVAFTLPQQTISNADQARALIAKLTKVFDL